MLILSVSCSHRNQALRDQNDEAEHSSFDALGDEIKKISERIDADSVNKIKKKGGKTEPDPLDEMKKKGGKTEPDSVEVKDIATTAEQEEESTSDLTRDDEEERKKSIKRAAIVGASTVLGGALISAATKAIISRKVLPAAYREPNVDSDHHGYSDFNEARDYYEYELRNKNAGATIFEDKFKRKYGSVDVLTIKPKAQVTGYIIAMHPNGGHYQTRLSDLSALAEKTGLGVISFNYPKGAKSADQVVKIGAELTKTYIEEVGARNVVLTGHSIGGAFASLIAGNLHGEGERVKLVTDRTFTSLATLVKENHGVPSSLASAVLRAAGWRMEPKEAINKIPPTHQHHYYSVRDEEMTGGTNTKEFKGVRTEEINKHPRYKPSGEKHYEGLEHNLRMSELETKDGTEFLNAMAATITKLLEVD